MKLAAAYPIRLICQVLDYPPSSYYYQPEESDKAGINIFSLCQPDLLHSTWRVVRHRKAFEHSG